MALHFSANQYNRNFQPMLLQNWEVPKVQRENPRAFIGFTQIVANDRGHLLEGIKRSRESPWGTFMGTWDIPTRIPGNNMLNSTARTEAATLKLQRFKTEGDIVLKGRLKKCKVPSPLPVKSDVKADETISPKKTQSGLDLTANGNGMRSGAQAPEPVSSAEILLSPQAKMTGKPVTPNIDWPTPKPGSGVRAKSGSPRESPKPLPPISSPKAVSPVTTPKPRSPAGQAPKSPAQQELKWPSPRPEAPQPV